LIFPQLRLPHLDLELSEELFYISSLFVSAPITAALGVESLEAAGRRKAR
jgi:hypothetical protein